jgi:hypothetical protein
VAVTGASGQISNHLLFMIASGEAFGKDQPIALQLLGSERSKEALEGVAMELEDSLYPLLREVTIGIDPVAVFKDADWCLMIGAKPRGPGMERADLLDLNGQIFQEQGRALNAVANPDCKVLVVGNPCNTNALIAMANAPNLKRKNFHALTRLDENRAKCQLALKAGKFYTSVSRVCVWGNHSTTQVRARRSAPASLLLPGRRQAPPAAGACAAGPGCSRRPPGLAASLTTLRLTHAPRCPTLSTRASAACPPWTSSTTPSGSARSSPPRSPPAAAPSSRSERRRGALPRPAAAPLAAAAGVKCALLPQPGA